MKRLSHRTRDNIIFLLILLNLVVLLGQLWPELEFPFARLTNLFFLFATLAFFALLLFVKKR